MNPTLAKITAATETLPDYAREAVENDLIEQAEASAKAWEAEKQRRDEHTMIGYQQALNGEGIDLETFEAEMDVFFEKLEANAAKR